MDSTDMISHDDKVLDETATRLIKALGFETAVQICRSNYWYGVLQLILDRENTTDDQTSGTISPVRLLNLPNAPYDADDKSSDLDKVAIAA